MENAKNVAAQIILVEDDPFLSEIYITRFEQGGFHVHLAQSGEAGMELVRTIKPALVVLDLVLPKLDGFTLLEQIKSDPELRDIPVILLTNLGQQEDIDRGMRLGAAAYLIKANFTPSEVIEKAKEVLAANSGPSR